MTQIEMLQMHIANTSSPVYRALFAQMVEALELSLRALDEDDFPALRQRIREVLEK